MAVTDGLKAGPPERLNEEKLMSLNDGDGGDYLECKKNKSFNSRGSKTRLLAGNTKNRKPAKSSWKRFWGFFRGKVKGIRKRLIEDKAN